MIDFRRGRTERQFFLHILFVLFGVTICCLAVPYTRAQSVVSGQVALAQQIVAVAGGGSTVPSTTPEAAASAQLELPYPPPGPGYVGLSGLVLDAARNLYIADSVNSVVEKVDASTGQIVVIAGGGSTVPSTTAEPATSAQLEIPAGIAMDGAGNLYIADTFNNVIEEVTGLSSASPQIIVIAGGGSTVPSTTAEPAISAQLEFPAGIVVDGAGNLYIVDCGNNVVEKVTGLSAANPQIVVIAGGGSTPPSTTAEAATSAQLEFPEGGAAVDATGNLYIAESSQNEVDEITGLSTASPQIVVVAGGGSTAPGASPEPPTSAQLEFPSGIAVDAAGDIYIANSIPAAVYKISASTGEIALLAGGGGTVPSGTPVAATNAQFNAPTGLAVDSLGNLYVADSFNELVEKVSPLATLTATEVGSVSASQTMQVTLQAATVLSGITVPQGQNGTQEFTVGAITGCAVDGVTTNALGSTCSIPVTFSPGDPGLRAGALTFKDGSTVVGAVGLYGVGLGPLSVFEPGTQTTLTVSVGGSALNQPSGAAVDAAGNLFIADAGNNRVLEIPAGCATTSCQTALGTGLDSPEGVAVDGAQDLYIADTGNNRIVEIPVGCNTGSCQAALAVTGLASPSGVALDGSGNLYVADTGNNRVVEVPAGCTTTACQITIGSGLNHPLGVAVDGSENVYIADTNNSRVLEWPAGCLTNACQTTVGSGLSQPSSVAVDAAGNVYIADPAGNALAEVATACSTGPCQAAVGSGLTGSAGVALDGSGNLYVANSAQNNVVEIARNVQGLSFPSTPLGQASAAQDVTLRNIGNQTLALSAVSATSNFNLNGADTTCPTVSTLISAGTCVLGVEFAPVSSGALTGTVNITDSNLNAPSAEQQINLAGTGQGLAAAIALSESPGTTVSYGTSVSVTATLSGGNGIPTGNVTYTVDAGTAQTATLNSSGVAGFTLPGTLAPGPHSVLVSYAGDTHYTVASVSQGFTLTVNATTQTISFPAIASRVYGSSPFAAPASASSGLTVTITVQSGPAVVSGNMVTVTGTGAVVLKAAQAGNNQYDPAASVTQSFQVTPAPLTVTAENASRVYGAANPVFTGNVSGAVNGDSFTESFSTTATAASSVGTYPIVPSVTGAHLADYAVNAANGTLTVSAAASSTVLTASADSVTAGQSVTLMATVRSGNTPIESGTVTFKNGTTALGTATLNAQGEATLVTSALPVGTDSLTANFGATLDYAGSTSAAATVTVGSSTPAGYTVTANPDSLTIVQGQTGSITLTITPTGGYHGSLTLSCANLPANALCTFVQQGGGSNTVSLDGNNQPVSVGLTIQTDTQQAKMEALPAGYLPVIPALAFWWPGTLAGFAGFGRKKHMPGTQRSGKRRLLCLTLLLAGLVAGLSGCGAGSQVTPTGSSAVTISAVTSAGGSESATLHLTISQ